MRLHRNARLAPKARRASRSRISSSASRSRSICTLFENDLQGGPVEVQTSATGTVPDDTPFLGGSGFSLDVTLVNSFDPPPDDPLLDQCAAYLP